MFGPGWKPKDKYNFYCGSCGCKYFTKPKPTRPAVDTNCVACGSSRIIPLTY